MATGFGSNKWKGKQADLKFAFYAAETPDEMLNAFTKMEPHFKDKDLGLDCFKLAQRLYREQYDPENILFYGKRALKLAIEKSNYYASSMMIPNILTILGSVCCSLKRYEESLSYLNWSLRNLSKLESHTSLPAELVLNGLGGTHYETAVVKRA